ncbi:MAG: hypothetical protein ACKO96_32375 [Flammeovirgaceae bacterium]
MKCKLEVLSSFNVWFRGQRAASEAGHIANTNVVGKAIKKTYDNEEYDFSLNSIDDNFSSARTDKEEKKRWQ